MPIRKSKAAAANPLRVNAGVTKGLLLKRVNPALSEYAKHHRIHSRIDFEAVITAQGQVVSLRTEAGPFELIDPAYEAVSQWEYKPYLINHMPVEVLTNIEINFTPN
ncbi:MAG: energy transducer TonB [Acidobacteriota bacterium]